MSIQQLQQYEPSNSFMSTSLLIDSRNYSDTGWRHSVICEKLDIRHHVSVSAIPRPKIKTHILRVFLSGDYARVWLEHVEFKARSTSEDGYITANCRANSNDPSYFVINNSTIEAIGGSVKAGSYFLGRLEYSGPEERLNSAYGCYRSSGGTVCSSGLPKYLYERRD